MSKNNLKIEYISVDELKTYENNAKLHPAEQVEQIKKSIEQFGMNDPIAVWKDNVIIEGHGRLIACKELGIETVPIIRLDTLTDEQRKAYMLAHNKLTMNTDFDLELLHDRLDEITNIDMTFFDFASDIDFALDDFFDDEQQGGSASESKLIKVVVNAVNEEREQLIELLEANDFNYEEK